MELKYLFIYQIHYGYPGSEREFKIFVNGTPFDNEEKIKEKFKEIQNFQNSTIKHFYYSDKTADGGFEVEIIDGQYKVNYSVTIKIIPVLKINNKLFKLEELKE